MAVGCGSRSGLDVFGRAPAAGDAGDASAGLDATAPQADATSPSPDSATLDSGVDGCRVPDGAVIDDAILEGGVSACGDGYAHPNVCCYAGPQQPTVCIEWTPFYPPFLPCQCGALTLPDPRMCCPLDDGGRCEPAFGPGGPGANAPGTCHNPCGPGSFPPGEISWPDPACTDVPSMTTDAGVSVPAGPCSYCCARHGATYGCTGNTGTCIPNPQGGSTCADQTFGCGACPDGWQRAPGVPDLCCRGDRGSGAPSECFSQAVSLSGNFRPQ